MNLRDFNDPELADELIRTKVLTQAAAERALQASIRTSTGLDKTVLELGLASEEQLYATVANWLDLPLIEADRIDPGLSKSLELDPAFLGRAELVPVEETPDGSILIATSNLHAQEALSSISFHLGAKIKPAIATRTTIKNSLSRVFEKPTLNGVKNANESDVDRLKALANEGPVIGQVNDLIAQAVSEHASDIHIEAMEASARIRFRVDGVLHTHMTVSEADRAAITSRLKVMGRLNISEKRRPQDGRAQVSVRGNNIDLRLSTLPTQHGESVVIRVLDQSRMDLSWDALGYTPERVAEIETIIHQPNGIFLVAGPTGSGKTTTLYTALSQINSEDRKIITVEDPIEYAIEGVSQVQVQPEIDMTFARALRAILRQDPDVVLVGEIRDQETAEIAVRAALVGRLVLSTVHTNDALSAIDRLLDLGIPSFLLAATLRGVLSQRLVRRTCQTCQGKGCEACNETGLKGRRVVSELMSIDADIRRELARIESSEELAENAKTRQFRKMAEDAEEMITQGLTTKEEILKLVD